MTIKKKKRRLRIGSLLLLIVIGYFIFLIGKYFYTLPVNNIYITGNTILTDQEIIDAAKLKNYPSIHKYTSHKIASNIKKLELVDDVKVRKSFSGKITITIKEAKPLFYYRNDEKVYLSNNKTIDDVLKYPGIPIIINYVPKKVLNELVKNFTLLSDDVVKQINEIEYSPDEKNGVTLDENRFIFRMNDTNTVFIDTINIAKLNNYQKIIAALEDDVHGYIYLNSNRDNASFQSYQEITSEEETTEEEQTQEETTNED